jgi:hypothetical protein
MDLGIGSLLNWLAGLPQLIYCTLIRWVCWFLDFFFQMFWGVLKAIIPQLPSEAGTSVNWIMQWYGAVDAWIPFSDGVQPVVALWVTVSVALMIVRMLRWMWPF